MITRALHKIAHWTGHNTGRVETWYDGDQLMVGFRCDCGELMHISKCRGIPSLDKTCLTYVQNPDQGQPMSR